MKMNIDSFGIFGLFGNRNISARIKDQKVVLIGENGLGKSTFMQVLFYVLTKKWEKLENIDFHSFEISISKKIYHITKDDLIERNANLFINIKGRTVSPSSFDRLFASFSSLLSESISLDDIDVKHLSILANTPMSSTRNFLTALKEEEQSKSGEFYELIKAIDELNLSVLYFPTYRKVEVELRSLLSDLDRSRFSRINEIMKAKLEGEIVSFGMSDVEEIIGNKSNSLSREFNESATIVMREMFFDVLSDHSRSEVRNEISINSEEVTAILKRMGSQAPSAGTKKRISRINSEDFENLSAEDKIARNFLTELTKLYRTQESKEKGITNFVEACNEFFSNKKMELDNVSYEIKILALQKGRYTGEALLDWSDLSSGEKQITSMFARFWLSDRSYIVLIDEPELSLSVEWQRKLLPLIDKVPQCMGIIAVTHSPFIFENIFDKYARDFKYSFGVDHDKR